MEGEYWSLCALPDGREVRPEQVLRRALAMVEQKWAREGGEGGEGGGAGDYRSTFYDPWDPW